MHHGLLSATPLLAALLGIWTPLSFATAKPLNKVDPTTFIISHQQQQSGTQAFPLLPAYHRHSSPSINPSAIGKRDGIHVQELSSNFILHYQIFQTFAHDWTTASRLATFWYNLGIQLPDVPDHLFLDNVLRFRSGPLSLELFDASGGAGGIPREFILALASAMVGYTERGFCGMFNARVSSRGDAVGGASAGVKLWITFRIVGGLGEAIRHLFIPAIDPRSSILRLAQLASSLAMGGGPDSKPEHLLVIMPFKEPTEIFDRIRKNHPNIKITFKGLGFTGTPWQGEEEIPKELYEDATILATLSALPPSPEACPNLQLIHFFSAGTNHIANSPIYTETSIPLTTSSGIHGPQIAEWVILTALAHSHHYSLLHTWQLDHNWGKAANRNVLQSLRDKAGQRLGVLGYGSIGRQVARVARGLGMDVIAYTASPRTTPESKHDSGFIVPGTGDPDGSIPQAWFSGLDKASLHHFLAQDIDHLLISVPLTKQTTHFLGAEEFAILGKKKNAFVSNISRGQIIVQSDLIASLKAYSDNDPLDGGDGGGGLRGAALDVADPEPLPKDDPLWDAPNCIVTPHISGLGEAYVDRAFQVLEVNLDRREKGERMINVVDRKRGY